MIQPFSEDNNKRNNLGTCILWSLLALIRYYSDMMWIHSISFALFCSLNFVGFWKQRARILEIVFLINLALVVWILKNEVIAMILGKYEHFKDDMSLAIPIANIALVCLENA